MKNVKVRHSLINGKPQYKNPFIIESAISGKKGVKIKTQEQEDEKEALKR